MLLEDKLDVLLSTGGQPNATGEEAQLVPLLDAARQLAPLRAATPSPAFVGMLHEVLLARIAALRVSDEAERADVSGDAYTEPNLEIVRPVASRPTAPRRQRRSHAPAQRVARWWQVAVAAMLCLLFGGVFLAAGASATPGSPLYALHRWEQGFRAGVASSPADGVRLHLSYADGALKSYDALVAARGDDAALADALATLLSEQQEAAQALSAVPSGGDHDELATQLTNLRQRTRDDLHAALARLDWNSRLLATAALGGLGERVLVVSTARVSPGDDDIPNAPWSIRVQGSGFVNGAIVLFGGQPGGKVVSVTPTLLVAEWTDGAPPRGVSVGIQNPDSTAAETVNVSFQSDDSDDASAAPSGTGTPNSGGGGGATPSSTAAMKSGTNREIA